MATSSTEINGWIVLLNHGMHVKGQGLTVVTVYKKLAVAKRIATEQQGTVVAVKLIAESPLPVLP